MPSPARLASVVLLASALGKVALAIDAPEEATAVTVSRDGFRPSEVRARKGDTVRLSVRSLDGEHCLAIDEFRVEKRVTAARAVTVEITADKAGRFEIRCCLGASHDAERKGTLAVDE